MRWVLALVLVSRAYGYVRTRSDDTGAPLTWNTSCIFIRADARGSQTLAFEAIEASLARSVANWAVPIDACGTLRLVHLNAEKDEEVGNDTRPVVVIRDQEWRRPRGVLHDPSAIALTTVFFLPAPGRLGDGSILDADIELNNVNFTLTTHPQSGMARPGTMLADLENTLTHELGHVLGLAHTCWNPSETPQPPLDGRGRVVPDCNSPAVSQEILDATMYPFATMPAETSKRSITSDDAAGVCETYPSSRPSSACNQFLQGGCSVNSRSTASPFALTLAFALAVTWGARCRRG